MVFSETATVKQEKEAKKTLMSDDQAKPKVIIGGDHGGFEMKEVLKKHLSARYEVEDVGTFQGKTVDYPDVAGELCRKLLAGKYGNSHLLVCTKSHSIF